MYIMHMYSVLAPKPTPKNGVKNKVQKRLQKRRAKLQECLRFVVLENRKGRGFRFWVLGLGFRV